MILHVAAFGGTMSAQAQLKSQSCSKLLTHTDFPLLRWSGTDSTSGTGKHGYHRSSKSPAGNRRELLERHWKGRQPMHPPRLRRTYSSSPRLQGSSQFRPAVQPTLLQLDIASRFYVTGGNVGLLISVLCT